MADDAFVSRLTQLIGRGEEILNGPINTSMYGDYVDSAVFKPWHTQCVATLKAKPGAEDYLESFRESVDDSGCRQIKTGVELLKAVQQDLVDGQLTVAPAISTDSKIERLFDRFSIVVRELTKRHDARGSLTIGDEYDVQDLMRALLYVEFEDIRTEEPSPSYAGKGARQDFLLKREQSVVEIKKTRSTLKAKEIGSQLIEDIARYKSHPDCKTLFCFVYDPDRWIDNPRGIEDDLSKDVPYKVRVYIRP